ncbi:barstar family protein [Kitasatospora sp. NPDC051853]|uniref:barstar family protein n=1 Tax=Kitasatospora sp. NPDC051853 TaxID=3364058 RepID=UPI0037AE58D6
MTSDNADQSEPWSGARVRARVAVMAQEDPELQRFGAAGHGYRLRPPLAEETIRSFESQHAVRLPDSYRSFLKDIADGGAGPAHGLVGLMEEVDQEEALYDLREEDRCAGFLSAPFPHTGEWPGPGKGGDAGYSVEGSLVIAEEGCGMFHRLVITGSNAGQVWLDDPDWGGFTPGPDFRDWYSAWLATEEDPEPTAERRVVDVGSVRSERELHEVLKRELGFPAFYGMNWDAFSDAVTGLVVMPQELAFVGWGELERRVPQGAGALRRQLTRYQEQAMGRRVQVTYGT